MLLASSKLNMLSPSKYHTLSFVLGFSVSSGVHHPRLQKEKVIVKKVAYIFKESPYCLESWMDRTQLLLDGVQKPQTTKPQDS